jgi:hypothetical protein
MGEGQLNYLWGRKLVTQSAVWTHIIILPPPHFNQDKLVQYGLMTSSILGVAFLGMS